MCPAVTAPQVLPLFELSSVAAQLLAALGGLAICIPGGKVSLNARPVTAAL